LLMKKKINSNKYRIEYQKINSKNLSDLDSINAVTNFFNQSIDNTGYTWYAIYNTNLFRKVWLSMCKSNIKTPEMHEFLNTSLSLCYGKFKYIKCNHYIRLANPIGNFARLKDFLNIEIVFNKKTHNDFLKLINYLSVKFKVNKAKMQKIVKPMIYTKFDKNTLKYSFINSFIKIIKLYILRVINYRFMSISTIIKYFNIFF